MAIELGGKDPYAEREAAKYGTAIKSREYIMALLDAEGRLMSHRALAEALSHEDEESFDALGARLRAMVRDGELVRNRRGHFGLATKMDLVRGWVSGHPDGFGFLVPDEGGDDVFLGAREMKAVLHGDRVLARITGVDRRNRREGSIVDVLERNCHSLVGRFEIGGGIARVLPSNKRISQDILVSPDMQGGAQPEQMVVVSLIEQPTRRSQPIGKIVEVLGDHMAPGMEVEVALRSHDIPYIWPDAVEQEVECLPASVPDDAYGGREDLREIPLITIDGADSKDFDDAVFCERVGRNWRLLVAIADVAHYVKKGSALDDEAWQRGNSVYFPQQVVPMLPEALSNDLCSIRPAEDRLCLVCEMSVSPAGRIRDYRFFQGVMRSHARLTYDQVAALVGGGEAGAIDVALIPHIQQLHGLYGALRQAREKRGAIDFDRPETRIVFDDAGKISRIEPTERNDAHRLIEECMILANQAAADFLLKAEMPSLFRVHAQPMVDKITDLKAFLRQMGLKLEGGARPQGRHYSKLLRAVRARPDCFLIETVMLRSLAQAVYAPENGGHFGLSLEGYAHFTSPIRRYPDLLVHRAIHHLIDGGSHKTFVYGQADMEGAGTHCTMTERRADDATRDTVDWLKCEYMMDRIGEVFFGRISGVTSFGLFVELDDLHVEGLVHVTSLENDYYRFDALTHCLRGEHSGVEYRLAGAIEIKVVRVDLDERKIDFVPAAVEAPAKTGKDKPKPKSRSKSRSKSKPRPGKAADKAEKAPVAATADQEQGKEKAKRKRKRRPRSRNRKKD